MPQTIDPYCTISYDILSRVFNCYLDGKEIKLNHYAPKDRIPLILKEGIKLPSHHNYGKLSSGTHEEDAIFTTNLFNIFQDRVRIQFNFPIEKVWIQTTSKKYQANLSYFLKQSTNLGKALFNPIHREFLIYEDVPRDILKISSFS